MRKHGKIKIGQVQTFIPIQKNRLVIITDTGGLRYETALMYAMQKQKQFYQTVM